MEYVILLVLILLLMIFALWGWTGILVCLVIIILIVSFFCLVLYGYSRCFVYTDKQIGKEIKSFLEYDFGDEYEVLTNEVRGHQDRPVHFVIKIPNEAMCGVKEFCNTTQNCKCNPDGYNKLVEYRSGSCIVGVASVNINYDDCTIDFSEVSC